MAPAGGDPGAGRAGVGQHRADAGDERRGVHHGDQGRDPARVRVVGGGEVSGWDVREGRVGQQGDGGLEAGVHARRGEQGH